MSRKLVLLMALIFVLGRASVLRLRFEVVEAVGTIYIRADGSVDPPTSPIQRTGDAYTFTDNIYGPIIVERDSIVVDGAGYSVQGAGNGTGIDLSGRSNVTLKNTRIRLFKTSVHLYESSNDTIRGNEIMNSTYGMWLDYSSSSNDISGNNLTDCFIEVGPISCNNQIYGNSITNGGIGLIDRSIL
jgi:parallel beta-helix repeat protein